MKLIKLFEQYVKEEAEMAGMPVSSIAVNPQTLLDNKSTEFNRAIGVKKLPGNFSLTPTNHVGVFPNEVDSFINSLDSPMGSAGPRMVPLWIQGKSYPGRDFKRGSGPQYFEPLKNRFIHHTDGLWYPAVEDLRVKYNLDESFETLGSSVNSAELAEAKKLLLECYQYWISSINAMPMPSGDV